MQIDVIRVEHSIRLIRGDKVILDEDLAELYGVETKNLVKAVKRNIDRFPVDFMFQLTNQEFKNLKFQTGTSSQWGGRRIWGLPVGLPILNSVGTRSILPDMNFEFR